MTKKTWIKVKRGLLEPKHRERLGVRIWLYLHILDIANWETGKVEGWKDKEQAEALDMAHRTLQDQRQKLQEDGYIICEPAFQAQTITIMNYTNPRSYAGEVKNRGTESSVPSEGGYGEFRTHGTESSVPIHTESSVPLHTVHTLTHKDSQEGPPQTGDPPPAKKKTDSNLMFEAVAEVCGYDLKHLTRKARGMLNQTEKQLREADYTADYVRVDFMEWWRESDWRGVKGQRPTPGQILSEIVKVAAPKLNGKELYDFSKQTTFERNMSGIRQILEEEYAEN